MTEYPLTEEHRTKFKMALERWQDELNLRDWRIALKAKHASAKVMADVEIDLEARVAKIALSKAWPKEPTDKELDDTALHELLHVLLKPLMDVVAKTKNETMIGGVEHSVINTLERVLGKP